MDLVNFKFVSRRSQKDLGNLGNVRFNAGWRERDLDSLVIVVSTHNKKNLEHLGDLRFNAASRERRNLAI